MTRKLKIPIHCGLMLRFGVAEASHRKGTQSRKQHSGGVQWDSLLEEVTLSFSDEGKEVSGEREWRDCWEFSHGKEQKRETENCQCKELHVRSCSTQNPGY